MIMKMVIAILILVTVGVASVNADCTHYISTTGDNGAAGTSVATAWATMPYAGSQLTAGNVLCVINGTYLNTTTITIANSGASGNPIIIKAYNGTPVIDGINGLATYAIGFYLDDKDYIRIEGPFEMINWYTSVFIYRDSDNNYISNITTTPGDIILQRHSDNNTIFNCTVHDTPWNAIASYGWESDQSIPLWNKNNTIQNCTVYNGGHNNIDFHSYNDGAKVIGNNVYNSYIIGIMLHNYGTLNCVIQDNIIHNNSWDGIEVGGKVENCLFENNTIYHNGAFSPPGPGARARGINIQDVSTTGEHPAFNIFRGNKIYNNDGSGIDISENTHDNLFVNNYVDDYDPQKSGFKDYEIWDAGVNNNISNEQNNITRIDFAYVGPDVTFNYTDGRKFSINGNGEYTTFTFSSGSPIIEVISYGTHNISGYVKYENGTGIHKAYVTNNVTSTANYSINSGFYKLIALVNGTYNITASKSGFVSNSTIITISGTNIENANLTLTEGQKGNISGLVTDSNVIAIQNVTVSTSSYLDTTNATGGYELTDVLIGDYTLTASKITYFNTSHNINVTAGNTTQQNFILNQTHYSYYNLTSPFLITYTAIGTMVYAKMPTITDNEISTFFVEVCI